MTPNNRCGAKIVLAKLLDACSVAASPTTGEVQSMKPTQLGVAKQPATFLGWIKGSNLDYIIPIPIKKKI